MTSRAGEILARRELTLDTSEQGAPGQFPEGIDPARPRRNDEDTIAGGDVRVFEVRIRETGVQEIAHVPPPARPRGRYVPLRRFNSIREEILTRPTFFEHWDGVIIDGRHLREREAAALRAESGWLQRQGLRVVVDLSSAINLYPGLRLIDNLAADYEASMAAVGDVLAKMSLVGARDLVLSLHRHPENNFTDDQTRAAFEATLKALTQEAAGNGVTLHLRLAFGKPPWNLGEGLAWIERIGAPNLKLAPSTALVGERAPTNDLVRRCRERVGLWFVADSREDVAGQVWDAHVPVASATATRAESIARWLATAPEAPWASDALLADPDAEYREAVALGSLR